MCFKRIAQCAAVSILALAGVAHAGIDVSPVAVEAKASALPKDWNKTAVFMEIFVRSYKDSDGDGIGDFNGLTSQLDYLHDLGVTGIWLMPMMPSQDGDHGYAVNDYRAVNPDYGTMADFERFVQEAHKRGIGVILDFVVNHSGSGNAIFQEAAKSKASPYRDWYVFADKNPGWYNEKMRGVSGAYYNDPWKPVTKIVPGGVGLYYGVFSDSMPDMNLKNPKVIGYLQDTMRFWMNRGVDGFRLDAVTMLIEDGPKAYFNNPANPGIVAKLRETLDEYDNRYMICEASEGADMYVKACSAFAYGVQQSIIEGAKTGAVQPALISQLQNPHADLMPLALQSHDAYVGDRLMNQFGVNDPADYKLSAAISILASATPFAYYGEEIGMSNGGAFNDPGIRSPMSWTGYPRTAGFTKGTPYRDVAINVASQNVAIEAGDPNSLLEYYRALYMLRRDHPVFGTGRLDLQSKAGDPTFVFTRTGLDDKVAVLVNLSDAPQALSATVGEGRFVQSLHVVGEASDQSVASEGGKLTVVVPAKTTWVFTKSQ
ncbi:alpha-amylase family glycosyl hydrolase [Asticcacaulis taihuensis]|uniref:Maltose alpha-D-glucosyltransferase/ alpha-amylase n=1 Tax=Asticcacaulis taihuensis TaxID=260084 RepID=A0A1G4Q8Q3_9CAUL|nr:alpha-amylase family glycosyl hydrolase [Asticcacaulis taihuensis]SCW40970.1 maltose alpha-D-glucosyltransferase/ alpha-amylase [Asticcacaulis taihuensis]